MLMAAPTVALARPMLRPTMDRGLATALLVGGVALTAAGPIVVATGSMMLLSRNDDGREGLLDHQKTGVGLMVAGGVSMAVGIPLLIVGARGRGQRRDASMRSPLSFQF